MPSGEVLDLQGALDRVENDRELFDELVAVFLEEYAEQLPDLETAVAAENATAVEDITHSIKSALGNVGAVSSAALASEMELSSRKGNLTALPGLLEALKAEIEKFKAEYAALAAGT